MMSLDSLLIRFDKMLRTISGVASNSRRSPAEDATEGVLDMAERRHSASLMRVNHVGEVCAQALYEAQAGLAQNDVIKTQFQQAAHEEEDHLTWTAMRLRELGSQPSLLNPVWYAGAYLLGTIAAHAGDEQSLGFVMETERQVEKHLASHLDRLPLQDAKSRAIVEQMRIDEMEHGAAAASLGGGEMPLPMQYGMRAMAKVMTTVAYFI